MVLWKFYFVNPLKEEGVIQPDMTLPGKCHKLMYSRLLKAHKGHYNIRVFMNLGMGRVSTNFAIIIKITSLSSGMKESSTSLNITWHHQSHNDSVSISLSIITIISPNFRATQY